MLVILILILPCDAQTTSNPDPSSPQPSDIRSPLPPPRGLVGDPSKHVLSPGDVIELNIHSLPNLPTSYSIRIDGAFYLPPIGDVPAAGKTLAQLESELKKRLAKELRRPQFRLGLKEVAPNRLTILGEVLRPGSYEVRPGSTVLDLIASAGGLTERADASEGRLLRSGGESAISLAPGAEPTVRLKDGDVVYISPGIKVNVTGEVFSPGTMAVPRREGDPLRALIRAGGPKPNASLSRVILFRPALSSTITLDLSPTGPKLPEAARQLEDGDVLVVPPRQAVVVCGGPKAVPLRGGENILDVVIAAGIGDNLHDVTIVRSQNVEPLAMASLADFQNAGVSEKIQQELKPEKIDLTAYFESRNPSLLVPINDGDIVLVPEKGPPLPWFQTLSAYLAPVQMLLGFGYMFRRF